MKDYIFGNLMDWGSVLEKLKQLNDAGSLDNHQDELIRLLRFDGNWRLREAAVEAASSLRRPEIQTLEQLVQLIKREDLYYNVRIMAVEALSTLIPVLRENKEVNSDVVHIFINETNHEVSQLLSSPAPPIFHDALDVAHEQIQKVLAVA